MEMISRDCSLCGNDEKSVRFSPLLPEQIENHETVHSQYEDTKKSSTWWHYRVVECHDCGHVYSDPVYPSKYLDDAYSFQKHDNQFGVSTKGLHRTNIAYARFVKPFLSNAKRIHIDIGCDTGNFLKAAKEEFDFKETFGVEPSEYSANKARQIEGVVVQNKFFDPKDYQEGSADLVSMIHVLDHLSKPREFIANVQPVLARGGVFFAAVHNINSLIAKFSGKTWHPLNLIHYDFYKQNTLRKLFESEGYEVLKVGNTLNYMDLSQVFARAPYLGQRMRKRLEGIKLFERFNLKLNLGNIGIVARKK